MSDLGNIAGMMSEDTEPHYSILYDPTAKAATVVNDPNGWMLEYDVGPQMMDIADSVRKVVMDCVAPANCAGLFKNFVNLEEAVFTNKWSMYDTTNTAYMFSGCSKLRALNCENWDVQYVRSYRRMFFGCASLEVLNLEKWNIRKEADMLDCFSGCSRLRTVGDVKWSINSVQSATDAQDVFMDCPALEKSEASHFVLGW